MFSTGHYPEIKIHAKLCMLWSSSALLPTILRQPVQALFLIYTAVLLPHLFNEWMGEVFSVSPLRLIVMFLLLLLLFLYHWPVIGPTFSLLYFGSSEKANNSGCMGTGGDWEGKAKRKTTSRVWVLFWLLTLAWLSSTSCRHDAFCSVFSGDMNPSVQPLWLQLPWVTRNFRAGDCSPWSIKQDTKSISPQGQRGGRC